MAPLLIEHDLETIYLYRAGRYVFALASHFDTPPGQDPQLQIFVAGQTTEIQPRLQQEHFKWNADQQAWIKLIFANNPWATIEALTTSFDAERLWEHFDYEEWRRFVDGRRRHHPNDIYKLYRRIIEAASQTGMIQPINYADSNNPFTRALDDLDRAIIEGKNQYVKLHPATEKTVLELIQLAKVNRPE